MIANVLASVSAPNVTSRIPNATSLEPSLSPEKRFVLCRRWRAITRFIISVIRSLTICIPSCAWSLVSCNFGRTSVLPRRRIQCDIIAGTEVSFRIARVTPPNSNCRDLLWLWAPMTIRSAQ